MSLHASTPFSYAPPSAVRGPCGAIVAFLYISVSTVFIIFWFVCIMDARFCYLRSKNSAESSKRLVGGFAYLAQNNVANAQIQ